MKLTAEQTLIKEAVQTTSDNLQIIARAGSGKTTTLCMVAHQISGRGTAISFNKKIAEELKERLPPNFESATMHSLGFRALREFFGKFPKLDDKKMYLILDDVVKNYLSPEEQAEIREDFSETLTFCRQAKESGYLPSGVYTPAKPLHTELDFLYDAEIVPTDLQLAVVREVVTRSFKSAMTGLIDFTDMVYLPALLPVSFPRKDAVLADEAQDLSELNHALLRKIAKGARLIAVGDPCQAIYAFRGASEESMGIMSELFNMKPFYLTICFRSAQEIVKNARWRAPDMQWREGAPIGEVKTFQKWSTKDILDGDAIICRNNSPLFAMALALIKEGRMPELSSGDIAKSIGAIFKKLGKGNLSQVEALASLEDWREKNKPKYKRKERLDDIVECVSIFLKAKPSLGEAILHFEQVLARSGRIKLMTGHKSKGLEFDRVFFLDRHVLKKEGQDLNIRYVIETRARESLFYVDRLGFQYGDLFETTSHISGPENPN